MCRSRRVRPPDHCANAIAQQRLAMTGHRPASLQVHCACSVKRRDHQPLPRRASPGHRTSGSGISGLKAMLSIW